MTPPYYTCVGLGANVPAQTDTGVCLSPADTVRVAMDRVAAVQGVVAPLSCSSLYLTEPMYRAEQPPFINAVIAFHTRLSAQQLWRELRALERAFGRRHQCGVANAPRPLDLDILWHAAGTVHTPELTVPHPRIGERRFVLQPLAEVCPDLLLPGFSASVAQLLAELPLGAAVHRYDTAGGAHL